MTMTTSLEFGLDTFGDVTRDAVGAPLSHAQVIRNVIDEAVLADELGIDFIGLGEHHRADFAISAPEVVLSAIAARTKRIRLGSSVTVLSSDDPIRVFQRFATVDAPSNGRAEVILGRGSFTETFSAFRFRPAPIRGAVGGETRPVWRAARSEARELAGQAPSAAQGSAGFSAGRAWPVEDVDRCRRQPPVCRARRALRPAPDARN